MIRFAILAALLLAGCGSWDTRAETHERTDVERSFSVHGSVGIPQTRADGSVAVVPVSVDLTLAGGGTDQTNGQSQASTEDRTAKVIAGALVAELSQRIPALASLGAVLSPAPASSMTDQAKALVAGVGSLGVAWAASALKGRQTDAAWDEAKAHEVARARAEARADALAEVARAPGARQPPPAAGGPA